MIKILEQLKESEQANKSEFKIKLSPDIKAIEVFTELKKKSYNPSLEEQGNDLYLVVPLKQSKVINLCEYQKKPKILSVEENLIRVNFGKNS